MRRRRLLMLAVAPLALVLLTSCFSLRGAKLTNRVIKEGGSTKIRINMGPDSDGSDSNGRPWFLVGFFSEDLTHGQTKWSVDGDYPGPVFMSSSGALRDAIVNAEECNTGGVDMSSIVVDRWVALVTPGNRSHGENDMEKRVTSTININGGNSFDLPGLTEEIHLFVGEWEDDGDGNPEPAGSSDDEYNCAGASTLMLGMRNG